MPAWPHISIPERNTAFAVPRPSCLASSMSCAPGLEVVGLLALLNAHASIAEVVDPQSVLADVGGHIVLEGHRRVSRLAGRLLVVLVGDPVRARHAELQPRMRINHLRGWRRSFLFPQHSEHGLRRPEGIVSSGPPRPPRRRCGVRWGAGQRQLRLRLLERELQRHRLQQIQLTGLVAAGPTVLEPLWRDGFPVPDVRPGGAPGILRSL